MLFSLVSQSKYTQALKCEKLKNVLFDYKCIKKFKISECYQRQSGEQAGQDLTKFFLRGMLRVQDLSRIPQNRETPKFLKWLRFYTIKLLIRTCQS